METCSSARFSSQVLKDRDVTLICEGRAYQLTSDERNVAVSEIEVLRSTQEETDTRVISLLYIVHTQSSEVIALCE